MPTNRCTVKIYNPDEDVPPLVMQNATLIEVLDSMCERAFALREENLVISGGFDAADIMALANHARQREDVKVTLQMPAISTLALTSHHGFVEGHGPGEDKWPIALHEPAWSCFIFQGTFGLEGEAGEEVIEEEEATNKEDNNV